MQGWGGRFGGDEILLRFTWLCDDLGMADAAKTVLGLPLACTLGQGDGAARVEQWKTLSAEGSSDARRSGNVLEVRYRFEPRFREELMALVDAERECCAFVTWTVGVDGDDMVVRVEAHPERPDDIRAIAGLFATE
jgi:hypothetical protein